MVAAISKMQRWLETIAAASRYYLRSAGARGAPAALPIYSNLRAVKKCEEKEAVDARHTGFHVLLDPRQRALPSAIATVGLIYL